jgi:hypothetical protein
MYETWSIKTLIAKTTTLDGKCQVICRFFVFNCQLFHEGKIMTKHRYPLSARIPLTLQYCLASSSKILLAIIGLVSQIQQYAYAFDMCFKYLNQQITVRKNKTFVQCERI